MVYLTMKTRKKFKTKYADIKHVLKRLSWFFKIHHLENMKTNNANLILACIS